MSAFGRHIVAKACGRVLKDPTSSAVLRQIARAFLDVLDIIKDCERCRKR